MQRYHGVYTRLNSEELADLQLVQQAGLGCSQGRAVRLALRLAAQQLQERHRLEVEAVEREIAAVQGLTVHAGL